MTIKQKLLAIQVELKAPKNQRNKFGNYNYRSAEDILEALKPLMSKYKCLIIISDDIENIGDRFYVKPTITLYDTGGRLMPYHNRVADEAPNFQVRIRANSYLEANKKMNQVIEELDRIGRFLSTDELTRYENVLRDGISIPMGKDENERHLRVQNFKAFRRDLEE